MLPPPAWSPPRGRGAGRRRWPARCAVLYLASYTLGWIFLARARLKSGRSSTAGSESCREARSTQLFAVRLTRSGLLRHPRSSSTLHAQLLRWLMA
ncbi:hypothetical protein, partial [Nonomuraea rubra]|uniref:hypothetical protein n=1 Tax=Nonomuraea rubra TaxID=46180 RepID=UPI0031E66F55